MAPILSVPLPRLVSTTDETEETPMNETFVTLSGWLGNDVSLRQAAGVPVAGFRVASTPRRFQRSTQTWEDGDTQWYSVNAWRALAENCEQSLRRGDSVVVHGKLSAHVWTNKAGLEVTTFEVEAAFVGHDLNRGTSAFQRRKAPAPTGPDSARASTAPEQPGSGAPEPAVQAA
jgi:single-strand DNA-binding protein